ncbi:hypothetical protein C2E23DRAFT_860533 [Lenzites betulinus]|nr:hypothetical protein C2E23DRAFT_860533 [Lenzites betulinus]
MTGNSKYYLRSNLATKTQCRRHIHTQNINSLHPACEVGGTPVAVRRHTRGGIPKWLAWFRETCPRGGIVDGARTRLWRNIRSRQRARRAGSYFWETRRRASVVPGNTPARGDSGARSYTPVAEYPIAAARAARWIVLLGNPPACEVSGTPVAAGRQTRRGVPELLAWFRETRPRGGIVERAPRAARWVVLLGNPPACEVSGTPVAAGRQTRGGVPELGAWFRETRPRAGLGERVRTRRWRNVRRCATSSAGPVVSHSGAYLERHACRGVRPGNTGGSATLAHLSAGLDRTQSWFDGRLGVRRRPGRRWPDDTAIELKTHLWLSETPRTSNSHSQSSTPSPHTTSLKVRLERVRWSAKTR